MTAETIDTATHRLDLLAHHDACRPCASLYEYARERQDPDALDAWRRQLAAHLTNEAERRAYDRSVRASLTRREHEWSTERVAAFRQTRREVEVA